MNLLAIDPGHVQSAFVLYDTEADKPLEWATLGNTPMLGYIDRADAEVLAIEMIASYGMPVGREVFETCVAIGRFIERWRWHRGSEPLLVYRADVKLFLTHSRRSKDANVRQALIDKFGPGKELAIGKKASQGPLYGLTGDCWAALGVAVTASETEAIERQPA
jgi:hypothetical protein